MYFSRRCSSISKNSHHREKKPNMYSNNVWLLCDKTLRIKYLCRTKASSCIHLIPPSLPGAPRQPCLCCQKQGAIPGRPKLFILHESVTSE